MKVAFSRVELLRELHKRAQAASGGLTGPIGLRHAGATFSIVIEGEDDPTLRLSLREDTGRIRIVTCLSFWGSHEQLVAKLLERAEDYVHASSRRRERNAATQHVIQNVVLRKALQEIKTFWPKARMGALAVDLREDAFLQLRGGSIQLSLSDGKLTLGWYTARVINRHVVEIPCFEDPAFLPEQVIALAVQLAKRVAAMEEEEKRAQQDCVSLITARYGSGRSI